MPINPKTSRQVAGYISPALKTRMRRIAKAKPRYTVSWQIEYALERTIAEFEAMAGFPPKRSGDKLP
jgi:hypothetical protein